MKKEIKKGTMVSVRTIINPCANTSVFKGVGKVEKIRTNKVGYNEYLVNGEWELLSSLEVKEMTLLTPTEMQMATIKATYPILKKDKNEIKTIYERGNKFAFRFTKDGKYNYRMFNGSEFANMTNNEIERYGYGCK